MMRVLQLAPASPFVSAIVGWMLYLDRRPDQALAYTCMKRSNSTRTTPSPVSNLGRGFAEALFSPIHRQQVSHQLPRQRRAWPGCYSLLLLSLIHQR